MELICIEWKFFFSVCKKKIVRKKRRTIPCSVAFFDSDLLSIALSHRSKTVACYRIEHHTKSWGDSQQKFNSSLSLSLCILLFDMHKTHCADCLCEYVSVCKGSVAKFRVKDQSKRILNESAYMFLRSVHRHTLHSENYRTFTKRQILKLGLTMLICDWNWNQML